MYTLLVRFGEIIHSKLDMERELTSKLDLEWEYLYTLSQIWRENTFEVRFGIPLRIHTKLNLVQVYIQSKLDLEREYTPSQIWSENMYKL